MGWQDDPVVGAPKASGSWWDRDPIADFSDVRSGASSSKGPAPQSADWHPLAGATGMRATPWYDRGIVGDVSVADALQALPAVGGMVGGLVGGGGGTAFGAGVGGAPGYIGGAALGGAGGESARQLALR